MKLNDPVRFRAEMHGDFSVFDRYMVEQRIKMYLVAGQLLLCILMEWLT